MISAKLLALPVSVLLSLAPQPRPLSRIADDVDKLATERRARQETIVPCGKPLQPVVNAAKAGDTILLQPQCRYVGRLTLGAKSGVVRLTTLRLPDRRIGPSDATLLPILASGGAQEVIDGVNAANWLLDGIQLEARTDGLGDVVILQDAVNVTLSRVLIVGGANGQKRGIRGNGKAITLRRSYIANMWRTGQDSQAFCAWDGAGPYVIEDNYLEAASENIMFGGADSKSADRIPADILIEGNLLNKNLAWKGVANKYAVKNLLELKSANRVLIRNNTLTNNWTDAQTGWALSFKSVNQNGHAPWSATEDVTVENNVVTDVEQGITIQGVTNEKNADGTTQRGGHTTRITIRNNQITTQRAAMQLTGGPGVITVDGNAFHQGGNLVTLDGPKIESFTFTNNQYRDVPYGIKGGGAAPGVPSLVAFCAAYTYSGNTIIK
jgi:hypothetical protein